MITRQVLLLGHWNSIFKTFFHIHSAGQPLFPTMTAAFPIQPVARFAGQSELVKRPKVETTYYL